MRVSIILAAFEAAMPLIRLALSRIVSNAISGYAQLIAGIALVVLGIGPRSS